MKRLLKTLGNVTLVIVIFLIGATVWFNRGHQKMESFCFSIVPGISVDDLRLRAEENGFRSLGEEGQASLIIMDPGSMGQFLCQVDVANGTVIKIQFTAND